MSLFDPCFFEEADTRERERLRLLGRFGRFKENLFEYLVIFSCMILGAAVTFIPWLIGVYFIIKWIFSNLNFW